MAARWRTTHWQHVRERELEISDPEFARHLREHARPAQIAFQRLMKHSDGEPWGIECKSRSREAWAFILPDVSGDSPVRAQFFDLDGFSGHFCYGSLIKAVEGMIADGYQVLDPGALDRVAGTERWAEGVRRCELRLQFNLGRITWVEMLERMSGKEAVVAD